MLAIIAYELRTQGYSWLDIAVKLGVSSDSARVSAAGYAKRFGLPWPLRHAGEFRMLGTIPVVLFRFHASGLLASIRTAHVRPEDFEQRRTELLESGVQLVSLDELVKMWGNTEG